MHSIRKENDPRGSDNIISEYGEFKSYLPSKIINSNFINNYAKEKGISLMQSKCELSRHLFAKELNECDNVSDITETLLKILQLEFGDDYIINH